MGAFTATATYIGRGDDAGKAYDALMEGAVFEHGHDAYNGTISTTSGFVVRGDAPDWCSAVDRRAMEAMGDDDGPSKWDRAWAYPIFDDSRREQVTAEVTILTTDAYGWPEEAAEVLDIERGDLIACDRTDVVGTPVRRVTQRATEGARVTRYLVVGQRRAPDLNNLTTGSGFATQAQARKCAEESEWSGEFSIVGVVVRDDGKPLVTGEAPSPPNGPSG